MATIPNIKEANAGCKYKLTTWHDVSKTPPELVGYGIMVKSKNTRFKPVSYKGEAVVSKEKKEVLNLCKQLNAEAVTLNQNQSL